MFPPTDQDDVLHQNVVSCLNTLPVFAPRWKISVQDVWMVQVCMNNAFSCTTFKWTATLSGPTWQYVASFQPHPLTQKPDLAVLIFLQ